MTRKPRVRKDGLCVQCRGERRMPKTRQKGIDPLTYLADPFCSSICCRAYFANPMPSMTGGNPKEKRGRYERAAV